MAELIHSMPVESMQGNVDRDHYTRRKAGERGRSLLCRKPRFSLDHRAVLRASTASQTFRTRSLWRSQILHNPILRAQWQQRHEEALREYRRHPRGRAVPRRLCDWLMTVSI